MTAPSQQASALNNLGDETSAGAASTTDSGALGAAVSNLSIAGQSAPAPAAAKPKDEPKKVKIEPADVQYLVEQLEVNKVKATEMLKRSGGDRMGALRAYVVGV